MTCWLGRSGCVKAKERGDAKQVSFCNKSGINFNDNFDIVTWPQGFNRSGSTFGEMLADVQKLKRLDEQGKCNYFGIADDVHVWEVNDV